MTIRVIEPRTVPTKDQLIQKYSRSFNGWEKIAASMVKPLLLQFDFVAGGPRLLGSVPSPEAQEYIKTAAFVFLPTHKHLEQEMCAIKQWMLTEVNDFIIQGALDQSTPIDIDPGDLTTRLDPEQYGMLIHGKPTSSKRVPSFEEYQVFCSPIIPEDVVIFRPYDLLETPGYQRKAFDIKVLEIFQCSEGLAARIQVTMVWLMDRLPVTETFRLIV